MLILPKPYPNSYFELSENITVPQDHVVNTDSKLTEVARFVLIHYINPYSAEFLKIY